MESSSTLKKQIIWKQSRELELFYQVSKRLYWSLFSFFFLFIFLFIYFFFKFYFIFKLNITVLDLPNIKMNPPQVYMCSPSWSLFSIVFWKLLRLEQGKSSLFSQLQTKKNRITLQQEKVGKIYQKDLFLKGQLNILMDRHESLQKIYP